MRGQMVFEQGLCRTEPPELAQGCLHLSPGVFLLTKQCSLLQVVSKELVCKSCLTRTLNKLETMMTILQGETTQGTVTPTSIADNILNITGQFSSRSNGQAPWRTQAFPRPVLTLTGVSAGTEV